MTQPMSANKVFMVTLQATAKLVKDRPLQTVAIFLGLKMALPCMMWAMVTVTCVCLGLQPSSLVVKTSVGIIGLLTLGMAILHQSIVQERTINNKYAVCGEPLWKVEQLEMVEIAVHQAMEVQEGVTPHPVQQLTAVNFLCRGVVPLRPLL